MPWLANDCRLLAFDSESVLRLRGDWQQRFENFSKSVQFFDEVMVVVNIHREGILRGFISFPPVDKSKLEFGQNALMGMFVDPMRE